MIHPYIRMIYFMALSNANLMYNKDSCAYDEYYGIVDTFYYETFNKPASFIGWAMENIKYYLEIKRINE